MKYILKNKKPVPESDIVKWATAFESMNKKVASIYIGDFHVSTIFLGINFNGGFGKPQLFETMVFYEPKPKEKSQILHDYSRRYATYIEAEQVHQEVVEEIKEKKDE